MTVAERLTALERAHLPHVSRGDARLLLALCAGYSFRECAQAFDCAERTARARIDRLRAGLFLPTGIDGGFMALAWWAGRHRACCLAAADVQNLQQP